jgi:peptide/nickel transport system substrate-binding protein
VVCCTSAPPPAPSPSAAIDTPRPGGRVVVASVGNVRTLQPVLSISDQSALIYPALVRNDPVSGAIVPDLAETANLSADGLTATYRLRPALVWSDGTPITGEDYRYAVDAVARSKATLAKSRFQDVAGWNDYVQGNSTTISGIEVSPDGRTVTIRLTRVFCAALGGLGFSPLPRNRFVGYWDDRTTDTTKNLDQSPLNEAPPVSSGPFVLKEFVPDIQTVLAPNDRYWRGRPLIDELVFKVYSGAGAVNAALLTGEAHMARTFPEDIATLATQASTYALHRLPGIGGYSFIGWNEASSRAPWLRDVRVRQALAYGLDVDLIIKAVLLGYGHRVFGHTPDASWAYDATGFNTYPYDVAKAKQLLEAAGARIGPDGVYLWIDGRPMRMSIKTNSGNKIRETVVQIAQEQYAKIGLSVAPELLSFPALTALLSDHGGDFDGVLVGWSLGVENPGTYAIWHSSQTAKGGQNFIAFADPDVDRFSVAGRSGPDCGRDARKKAFVAADRILNAQVPYTFLYSDDQMIFTHASLRGIEPTSFDNYSFWNVEKWWLRR